MLLDYLTAFQISEWEAYDRIDPLGTWMENYRLAYLSSLLTNLTISTHGKKGAKFTTPMDFMLDWDLGKDKPIKQQSAEEMKEILLGLADTINKDSKKQRLMEDLNKRPPRRFRTNKHVEP